VRRDGKNSTRYTEYSHRHVYLVSNSEDKGNKETQKRRRHARQLFGSNNHASIKAKVKETSDCSRQMTES
jgi:hypothetical protein